MWGTRRSWPRRADEEHAQRLAVGHRRATSGRGPRCSRSSSSVTGVSAKELAVRASVKSSAARGRASRVLEVSGGGHDGSSESEWLAEAMLLLKQKSQSRRERCTVASHDREPRPDRASTSPASCDAALSRAFAFLGKRWNGVLLATSMRGPAGFAELKRGLASATRCCPTGSPSSPGPAWSRATSTRGRRSRSPTPSPAGAAVLPALKSLTEWARENLSEERCQGAPRGGS